jgi:hypothetical protein
MHADDELVAFQNEVCRKAPVPMVKTPAPHRCAKIPTTKDGLARRSTWVAAQGRHGVESGGAGSKCSHAEMGRHV